MACPPRANRVSLARSSSGSSCTSLPVIAYRSDQNWQIRTRWAPPMALVCLTDCPFEDHVAVAGLVLIEKALQGPHQPLPVWVVGKHKDVLDGAVDQVDAFDEVHLPVCAAPENSPRQAPTARRASRMRRYSIERRSAQGDEHRSTAPWRSPASATKVSTGRTTTAGFGPLDIQIAISLSRQPAERSTGSATNMAITISGGSCEIRRNPPAGSARRSATIRPTPRRSA